MSYPTAYLRNVAGASQISLRRGMLAARARRWLAGHLPPSGMAVRCIVITVQRRATGVAPIDPDLPLEPRREPMHEPLVLVRGRFLWLADQLIAAPARRLHAVVHGDTIPRFSSVPAATSVARFTEWAMAFSAGTAPKTSLSLMGPLMGGR